MIQPRIVPRRLYSQIYNGSINSIPQLPQLDGLKNVPHFLSSTAFELSWNQYQSMLHDNLRRLLAGTELLSKSPKDILFQYSRDPIHTPVFNYASMAHNNHFFFQTIARDRTTPESMDPKLKQQLLQSFGSIKTLKLEMLKTAKVMFGPGFVWLVKDFRNNYSILATYLAGSPYPEVNYKLQPVNVDNLSDEITTEGFSDQLKSKFTGQVVNQVGLFGDHSKPLNVPPGAPQALVPVLCINVWQHMYIADYGLNPKTGRGGKPGYVENWWDKILWDVVSQRALGVKKVFVR